MNDTKNHRDSLDEAYASLYKSLGVEPGLLSKSDIGKKIENKYSDDNTDAQIYSEKYSQKKNDDIKTEDGVEILEHSPFNTIITDGSNIPDDEHHITLFGHRFYVMDDDHVNTIITKTEEVKDTIWQYIRKIQIRDNLTNEEVRKEIQTYLDKYDSNYFIGSY